MEWIQAQSSLISMFGYDQSNNTLYVQFKNGTIYEYNNVPEEYYNNMKMAESVGRYFSMAVKPFFNGKKIQSNKLMTD